MGTKLASLLAAAAALCPAACARTTPAAPKPRSAPLVPGMLFSSHSSTMLASQRGLVAEAARPGGSRNTQLLSALLDRLRIFKLTRAQAARVLIRELVERRRRGREIYVPSQFTARMFTHASEPCSD